MQVKDLTTQLEEGLANATKAAKREASKLQQRVRGGTWVRGLELTVRRVRGDT